MNRHVLDRPVWNALSLHQSQFSVGNELARRFSPDIGPLAASCDDSPESLSALAELIPASDTLLLLQADPIALPSGVIAVTTASGVQMVSDQPVPTADKHRGQIERLEEPDIPAMVSLATLTKPGPFESGTPRLGDFWGIKRNGRLVAMAGERMRNSGFAEISGVCVHPEFRGHGFARILSSAVAARIRDRGEIPYLHSYATNTAAIQLYESLGFRVRCPVNVASVAREGDVQT